MEERERVAVDELCATLATSSATVRRDLSRLQRAGFLQRVHGGAVRGRKLLAPLAYSAADDALARSIRGKLTPGDAVILEGRRIMPVVAQQLAAEPIRLIVVTNALEVAHVLLGKSEIDVILLGGKLHPNGYTLPQPLGANDLKFLVAMKAFVEVEGVHETAGVTATTAEDANYKHELLQHALQKTIVAPAGRWGLAFRHRITQLSSIDAWITTPMNATQRAAAAKVPCEVEESR